MDDSTAQRLIDALAAGIQPFTGEALEQDHLFQHPEIIRALYLAARALREHRPQRRSPTRPANTGKPWHPTELGKLADAFQAGKSLEAIATELQRTPFGVQARLELLGLIAPTQHRWQQQNPPAPESRSV